jgi:DNA gyrase subunit A
MEDSSDSNTPIPSLSHVKIEDEMRQSYMDYAMSVIVGRALPDVRDGLKPVQRRVLYAMYTEGNTANKKHSKCAGVVGEVLKRLHPHGDIPVYEALARLAQPWNLRYLLVDGQGNFGSIDGDPPAAYRYTECRLTRLAESLLDDLDKETVDFHPNFDDSNIEPEVLPSMTPNLLINGSSGIAVGMATHIPPHNLREVIDGTIALIENTALTNEELLNLIPGPDFPTGGIIYGRNAIVAGYLHGKGIIQVRAKADFETIRSQNKEIEAIVISEIPYQVNKSRLLERIAELVSDKEIEGIARFRDESDRKGMRIVIELKRDATAEIVLNQLYKSTPLQSSFGMINLAIVEGKPVVCSLRELLSHFIDHRRDVVTRRTEFALRKNRERLHILEGLRIVLLNLDEVIKLIRGSETVPEAKENLMNVYALSVLQAQAILEMRLQKLTGLERLAIEKEYEEVSAEISRLLAILEDTKKIDALITDELRAIQEKFGDDRRTLIVDDDAEIVYEDMIEDDEMAITISHQGYIRRTSLSEYRAQKRGGKGVTGASLKEEDYVENILVATNRSHLMIFTSLGRLFWQKVYEIPEAGRASRGRALVNLLDLKEQEKLTAIVPLRELTETNTIVMTTRSGVIKRVALNEFNSARKGGVIACTLDDNDQLIGVAVSSGSQDVILVTKFGMSIRFNEEVVRVMGRTARGVRGINLEEGDEVVGMTIAPRSNPGTSGDNYEDGVKAESVEAEILQETLLTICENGYGKRTKLSDYRVQGRGGRGIIDIQTEGRNGPVTGAFCVKEEEQVMIITSSGKIIRIKARDISVIGRNTRGVRLINLEDEEKVVAITRVMETEEEETGEEI